MTNFDQALTGVFLAGGAIELVPGTSGRLETVLFPTGTTARYFVVTLRSSNGLVALSEVEVMPTVP